jgi:hypothetical protein
MSFSEKHFGMGIGYWYLGTRFVYVRVHWPQCSCGPAGVCTQHENNQDIQVLVPERWMNVSLLHLAWAFLTQDKKKMLSTGEPNEFLDIWLDTLPCNWLEFCKPGFLLFLPPLPCGTPLTMQVVGTSLTMQPVRVTLILLLVKTYHATSLNPKHSSSTHRLQQTLNIAAVLTDCSTS